MIVVEPSDKREVVRGAAETSLVANKKSEVDLLLKKEQLAMYGED